MLFVGHGRSICPGTAKSSRKPLEISRNPPRHIMDRNNFKVRINAANARRPNARLTAAHAVSSRSCRHRDESTSLYYPSNASGGGANELPKRAV